MTSLWGGCGPSGAPALERWLDGAAPELRVGKLPRPAWPIVAGSIARACEARGRPLARPGVVARTVLRTSFGRGSRQAAAQTCIVVCRLRSRCHFWTGRRQATPP